LPHISPEVQKLYDYPEQFARDIFDRIEHALRSRAFEGEADAAVKSGRLHIVSADELAADQTVSPIPDLPAGYFVSSDQAALLHDRLEGMFLVSYQTPGGWMAITKDVLTEVLGAGRDVKVVGLPSAAAGVLRLTCPGLV